MQRISTILTLSLLHWVILTSSLFAQTELQYQSRGDWSEGIKPQPVSGADIELISVRVNYKDVEEPLPAHFRLKFFLKEKVKVFLTVRELENKHFYWLDKVYKENQPWQEGFGNVFRWPTKEVVQNLKGLHLSQLVGLARLKHEEPRSEEQVAPIILYHSSFPPIVNSYLFTLKTNGDARLTCTIFTKEDFQQQPNPTAVFRRTIRRQRGGRPFTVRWNTAQTPAGWYTLQVKGYFLSNNAPIDQIVHVYHQPTVQKESRAVSP